MSAVAFDTLKFVQKLEAAGVQRPHAVATAEAVVESIAVADLATKSDITAVKADIAMVRTEVAAVKTELKNDIATVRAEAAANKAELKNDIAMVRTEIAALEQKMTIKLGGMLIVMTGVLLAAIRYLGH